jgi:hypothetical protein
LIQFKSFCNNSKKEKGHYSLGQAHAGRPIPAHETGPWLFFPASHNVCRPAVASAVSSPWPVSCPLSSTVPRDAPARQTPPHLLLCLSHITRFSRPSFPSAPRSSPATEWFRPPLHRLASETVAHRPFLPPRHPLCLGVTTHRSIRHSTPLPHRAAAHGRIEGDAPARPQP